MTPTFSDCELRRLVLKWMNLQEGCLRGALNLSFGLASLSGSPEDELSFETPADLRNKPLVTAQICCQAQAWEDETYLGYIRNLNPAATIGCSKDSTHGEHGGHWRCMSDQNGLQPHICTYGVV